MINHLAEGSFPRYPKNEPPWPPRWRCWDWPKAQAWSPLKRGPFATRSTNIISNDEFSYFPIFSPTYSGPTTHPFRTNEIPDSSSTIRARHPKLAIELCHTWFIYSGTSRDISYAPIFHGSLRRCSPSPPVSPELEVSMNLHSVLRVHIVTPWSNSV